MSENEERNLSRPSKSLIRSLEGQDDLVWPRFIVQSRSSFSDNEEPSQLSLSKGLSEVSSNPRHLRNSFEKNEDSHCELNSQPLQMVPETPTVNRYDTPYSQVSQDQKSGGTSIDPYFLPAGNKSSNAKRHRQAIAGSNLSGFYNGFDSSCAEEGNRLKVFECLKAFSLCLILAGFILVLVPCIVILVFEVADVTPANATEMSDALVSSNVVNSTHNNYFPDELEAATAKTTIQQIASGTATVEADMDIFTEFLKSTSNESITTGQVTKAPTGSQSSSTDHIKSSSASTVPEKNNITTASYASYSIYQSLATTDHIKSSSGSSVPEKKSTTTASHTSSSTSQSVATSSNIISTGNAASKPLIMSTEKSNAKKIPGKFDVHQSDDAFDMLSNRPDILS